MSVKYKLEPIGEFYAQIRPQDQAALLEKFEEYSNNHINARKLYRDNPSEENYGKLLEARAEKRAFRLTLITIGWSAEEIKEEDS